MAAKRKSVNQKELAERLGISAKWVRDLEKKGLPKDGEGHGATYPWPEAREWYNDHIRALERKKEPEDDLKKLRLRKMQAEVAAAELSNAEAEGRVVPFEIHEQRVGAVFDRLRAIIMTIPSKYLGAMQRARTPLEASTVGEQIRDDLLRAFRGTAEELDEELDDDAEETAEPAGESDEPAVA